MLSLSITCLLTPGRYAATYVDVNMDWVVGFCQQYGTIQRKFPCCLPFLLLLRHCSVFVCWHFPQHHWHKQFNST